MSKSKIAPSKARHFKASRRSPANDLTRETMRSNKGRINQTTIIDLRKLKRTDDKVREPWTQYRILFDLVPVAVYTCDANGMIREYNRRAAELWGREPGRNGNKPRFCGSYKIYYPDGRAMPHKECPMARALRGEKLKPEDLEIVVERPNGERRHVIPAPRILTDEHGKITGAINCLFDVTEHKRTETAAMRLAAVVQSSHDAIAAKTLNGIITDWNQSAERIFGYKRKEIIGKSVLTLIPKGRQREEDEILRTIGRGESLDHYGTVRRRKDGKLIDVSLTISPIKDSKGDVVGVSKIARDITGQKQTERRLAEQARLLDLTNDAIIVRDVRDRIVYWNRGAQEMYGFSAKEALGEITHKLLRTEHPENIKSIRERLARNNRWSGELIHTRKDGKTLTVFSRWSLDRDERGRPASILETNTDVTARRQAEVAVRHKEAELEQIVTQTPFMLTRCTRDLRYRYVSRAYAEMFGRKPQEFAGKAIVEIIGKEALRTILPHIKKVLKGESAEYEMEVPFQGLGVRWINCVYVPDRDSNGNVMGWFASLIDVGLRKKAEAVLQKSKELSEENVRERTRELDLANKELQAEIERRKGLEGEILSISDREQQRLGQELHDGLCQHLTAVAFMARSIALRLKNHRVIEVGDIEKIAQLVNDAATDTRDLSRALHRLDVDAAALVPALQDLVDREIWRTPCRLEVKPSFRIDDDAAAAHLYRIAREAVINANKHAQAREIVVRLEGSRSKMVLHVIDDGIGISDEPKLKKGLGLHIMTYRSQLAGGRLEVDSPKNGGTRVSCYLPYGPLDRRKSDGKENGEPPKFSRRQQGNPSLAV
jgi:PAS domain S-box-containing protein